jgi:Cu-Zn family superoxide dismutase
MRVSFLLRWTIGAALVLAAAGTAAHAQTVKADLKSKDGQPAGSVTITSAASGVLLVLKAEGLAPGPHAIRFHETGKCDGDFSSAGGTYNPLGAEHGLLSETGPMAGDLPNIVAGADGKAEAEILSPFVHLGKDDDTTLTDEDGTALLIFEKADDHLTAPDGGAGPAVACGVLAEVQ